MTSTLETCQAFLTTIFAPEDVIEFRVVNGQSHWGNLSDLPEIVPSLVQQNDAGKQIYFGGNPRKARGGTKTCDVRLARCLFADFDDNTSVEDALRRIRIAGLPSPTIVVKTGGGVHVYWLLEKPCTDLAAWKRRMKEIIAALGSDKTIKDPPRVMRAPGFANVKYDHRPIAEIVVNEPTRVYPWEAMIPRDMARQSRDFLTQGKLLADGRRQTVFTTACDLNARGWRLSDAEAAIMEASSSLGLEHHELEDLPRQIANAFNQRREPTGGNAVARRDCGPHSGEANLKTPSTCTDTGLAKRLCREGAGTVLWVTDRRIWSQFDGRRWVDDPDGGEPRRIAKRIATTFWGQWLAEKDDLPALVIKFCTYAASRRGIDAAVALAKSESGIEVSANDFDTNRYELNCQNGIVDLRTMSLRPHDPAARLTKLTPVDFDPNATCPQWERFISDVMLGDAEMIGYLQRSFGLALSGDVSEQVLWCHVGNGGNGKSTAFAILSEVFGDYAAPIPADILITTSGERDREKSNARLVGHRLCFAQEPDDAGKLAEGTIKAITGGDPLTARTEYERARRVKLSCHIHVCMNRLPQVRGTDEGIWRRLQILYWGKTFAPEEQRPRTEIERQLLSEAPGILRWLCNGFSDWQSGGLRPPGSVTAATVQYREFSDSVARWLASDAVVREDGVEVPASVLYEDYCQFCAEERCPTVTQTMFGRTLENKGIRNYRPKSGQFRDVVVRVGLRLASCQSTRLLDVAVAGE